MRKGFIVVLCIVISVLVWAEESTQATSSVHLPKVYPYYVLVNDDETFGLSLNFEYNTFNELNSEFNQGIWEVRGDTFSLINGYNAIGSEDVKYADSHPDSINPYWFLGPSFLLWSEKRADFIIKADGDSLIAIIRDMRFVGMSSSRKDAGNPPCHNYIPWMVTCRSTLAPPSPPKPVIRYDKVDGVRWVKIPSPELCGVFDVRRIDRAQDFTLVVAEKDSMTYYIAAAPGAGQWVEDVRVGSKVPLRLSRFEADRHPRSVTSYPDSIYVMYYDVYGYWNAEWCEECRKMDNDRGSYYKRMLDSIVEARPVRQDTILR